MPRMRFVKQDNAVWISHLDLMRLLQRAFRRAGILLKHSQGYSPHPELSILLPLSVGVSSQCELADFSLDKAYFAELTRLVQDLSDEGFAKTYVKLMIDSANLRSTVRTRRMGKDSDFLSLALVDGGEINAQSVLTADSGEALAELYRPTRLAAAAEAGSAAMNGGSLTAFERTCDNALLDYVKEAKRMRFGAAHVVSYLAAMENEATAARMILSGRMAGLKPDTIRERMREAYA